MINEIQIAGRFNGAEIARVEWAREGRVPLQTLRAKVACVLALLFSLYFLWMGSSHSCLFCLQGLSSSLLLVLADCSMLGGRDTQDPS
jgi:hypothetical protein